MALAEAVIVEGHRVASGLGGDPRFPKGTITLQLPTFRAYVPDFIQWLGGEPLPGTINLQMSGPVAIGRPVIKTAPLRWTDFLPPECFFLSRAELTVDEVCHPAWLYIPDPETKPDHFQAANILELIARPLAGISYGRVVQLNYDARAISIA